MIDHEVRAQFGSLGWEDEAMSNIVTRWLIGLAVSLVVGQAATWGFVWCLRRRLERLHSEREPAPWHVAPADVPPWLTGSLERLFFTVAVGFDVSGFVVAMVAWIAIKMGTDWNRPHGGGHDPAGAWTALLGGFMSMFFALIGGLICRGAIG
jgi:hypothetical protein